MGLARERRSSDSATVRLPTTLTIEQAGDVYTELSQLASVRSLERVAIDFEQVERLDSAGVIALRSGGSLLERNGKRCEFRHLSESHRSTIEMVAETADAEPAAPAPQVERIGEWGFSTFAALVELAEMVVDTVKSALLCLVGKERVRSAAFVEQTVIIGVNAIFIVALIGFLIGLILAFQAAVQLQEFGASIFMANIVGLGMVREFGSIMTAIILAGRSGAAMAAEIGTMSVNSEIDALRTIGVSPVSFLVLPRVAAITVVEPVLSLLAMAVGLAAGLLISGSVGLPVEAVHRKMQQALALSDFYLGLGKSVLFAWIIGFTGCYMGFRTRGGAHSVGRNTTRAVVVSIFLIIVVDALVTTIWTLGHG